MWYVQDCLLERESANLWMIDDLITFLPVVVGVRLMVGIGDPAINELLEAL